jgi:alanyl-tRNA synthetase
MRRDEDLLAEVADLVGAAPDDVPVALRKRLDEIRALRTEVRQLQQQAASGRAGELAGGAIGGVVVARVDGIDRDALRDLAVAVRDHDGVRAVVLGAALDGGGVALVSAVAPETGITATELLDQAATTVQGGFNRRTDAPLIIAGGKNVDALGEALDQARAAAGIEPAPE